VKGQSWSYDLLVGITIFTGTLILALFFSWSVTLNSSETTLDELSASAWSISGLLMTPGNPADWNSTITASNSSTWSGVTTLGMTDAFGSQNISDGKARALLVMSAADYASLKQAVRTPYELYVEVKEFYDCNNASVWNSTFNCSARGIVNGTAEWSRRDHYVNVGGSNFTLGVRPDATAHQVAAATSFAFYNNSLVRVRVISWANRTWQ